MTRPLERILHVDDDPDIQEIVRLALETMGDFNVETCGSGREALGRAAAFKPDLMLLDVIMPDVDGLELLEQLRALPGFAEVPVMFMTSAAETADVGAYRRAGALEVIMKPFDHVTLADTIRECWAQHFD